jgi:uncharacterized membrane protein
VESFLILAMALAVVWLVVRVRSGANKLRLLQEEIGPLSETVRRLERQLKELKDEVHKQQEEPRSILESSVAAVSSMEPLAPAESGIPATAQQEQPALVHEAVRASTAIPAFSVPGETVIPPHPSKPLDGPPSPTAASQPEPGIPKPVEPPLRTKLPSPLPPALKMPKFDWEGLVGVKLFSWIAAIAMVVAAIFFLNYSIDQGWLQPPVQMTIGILVGLGLLVLCEVKAAHKYRITANAMDASAVAILFATFYAAYALWHLVSPAVSFFFLVPVAVVAVLLSIRRDSLFIALLGLMGGFAAPALLSAGENHPITLFSYLLLLNAGLAWVAAQKRWPLLTTLSLAFTTLYQWGWVLKFLTEGQLPLALGIFLVFPILTFVALTFGRQGKTEAGWASLYGKSVEMSAVLPVLFAVYLASVSGYGIHYGILFGFLFLLSTGLFALAVARGQELLHLAGAISTLVVFAVWFSKSYDSGAWPAILAFLALFVLFYLIAPMITSWFDRRFKGPCSRAVFAAPLLLSAFSVLAVIEPGAAAPELIFGVLFLLLAAATAFAVIGEQGAIYFLAAFFALVAEAAWSAKYLTAERLMAGLAIYGIFGLFYIGVPMAARRWQKTLRPEGAGAVLVLVSVALLFFIADGGVAVWGLALLLLILNLGLLLEGSASRFPHLTIAGMVLSWAVLGYFWAHAALAEILVPALIVVAGFAIMAMAGMIWLRKCSAGKDEILLGNGVFLGLVGHLFLLVVASQKSLAVPPWPFLAILLVLDLAAGVAVLYTRRHELLAAVLVGSALILMVWVGVAAMAPWPSVAILSAGVLALFSFVWIYLVKRIGIRTAPYANAAALTVFLAQIVTIIAAEQPGAPEVSFLILAHMLLLGALLCLAWFRSEHFLMVLAVMPAAVAVSLWMVGHAESQFWQFQLLFAGLVYLVFLAYPLALGRRAGRSLEPYLGAALASVPFFFQARQTIIAIGRQDIIGVLPVIQALLMAVLLWELHRIEPPGERALGRLALIAGMALGFVTVAIPLQLERQWITIAWALEGAALAWLYRRIPHRGLLFTSSGLLTTVFTRLVLNVTQLSYEPRSVLAIWNWYLYTYLVCATAMIFAGWLLSKTEDTVLEGVPRASKLFPAGGAVLLFLLLNIEIADYFSLRDHITFNLSATLAQDLTYTLGWALFAVALLAVGIAISSHAARVSSLGLLVITILKCFLHDLGRLGGLYRVVSFVGLAICLALVALALQKFVLAARKEAG